MSYNLNEGRKLKLQKLMMPIALIAWITIVVAALSYSPAPEENEYAAIEGVVVPNEVRVYVYVLTEDGIIASTQSDPETGKFEVTDLSGGTYSVELEPVSVEYRPKELPAINVSVNETKNLGELVLDPVDQGDVE